MRGDRGQAGTGNCTPNPTQNLAGSEGSTSGTAHGQQNQTREVESQREAQKAKCKKEGSPRG